MGPHIPWLSCCLQGLQAGVGAKNLALVFAKLLVLRQVWLLLSCLQQL